MRETTDSELSAIIDNSQKGDALDCSLDCKHDINAISLLTDAQIFARIIKLLLREFCNVSVEEIEKSIQFYRENPGKESNMGDNDVVIIPSDSVSKEQRNGEIRYDKHYNVKTKNMEYWIKLELEAQNVTNDKTLGYHLENRVAYNLGRMMSGQKFVDFSNSDFDRLKKVKSIWICLNQATDSIIRFTYKPSLEYGDCDINSLQSEQFEGIIVNVRGSSEKKQIAKSNGSIISFLEAVFKVEDAATKKKVLQEEFHLKITNPLERRLEVMCGVTEFSKNEGREEGLKVGREEGIRLLQRAYVLHKQGCSFEEIADTLKISTQEAEKNSRSNFSFLTVRFYPILF